MWRNQYPEDGAWFIAREHMGDVIAHEHVGNVILSEAKNLRAGPREILRFAQNERRGSRVSNNLPV